MTYGSRDGIENRFGKPNVSKWADLSNNEDLDEIAARITWALGQADTDINTYLRDTQYTIPFTEPADDKIVQIADILAGVHLYESRGVTDADEEKHQLTPQKETAMKDLARIKSGSIIIDVTQQVAMYPQVVVDDS